MPLGVIKNEGKLNFSKNILWAPLIFGCLPNGVWEIQQFLPVYSRRYAEWTQSQMMTVSPLHIALNGQKIQK